MLILASITAFALAVITTPLVMKFASKFGFVDNPATHIHPAIIHNRIIPRGGGLAIYLAILPTIFLFTEVTREIGGLLLGAAIAVIIGTLDDKYDLSPWLRLISNFIVAGIIVLSGIGIASVTNPFGGIIRLDQYQIAVNIGGQHTILVVADILAMIWIVWVMNMLNWSKGVDGQMPGIVIIACLVLAAVGFKFLSLDPKQLVVIKIALITAGATAGFLIYNFHPAKIFPGYGATILGLIIASLAIMASGKVATAILVLAVPMIDGIITVIRRIIKRQSPLKGDRQHLHHLLLDRGWSQRKIALFYWGVCAILGAVAINLKSLEKAFVVTTVFIIIAGGIIWLTIAGRPEKSS